MIEWKPIQPDTVIRITAQEFETNYVSRKSFDVVTAELAELKSVIGELLSEAMHQDPFGDVAGMALIYKARKLIGEVKP